MKNANKTIFFFIIFFTILEIAWSYFYVSKPKQIIPWDEAGYIEIGYRFHQALRAFDLKQVYEISKNEFYYPFSQAWFLGLATQAGEYTIVGARLASGLLFLPLVVFTWLIASGLNREGKLTPFLAVFFVLTSPLFIFNYAIAMKEGLGATLTVICFYLYFLARKKGKLFLYFICSLISLALTMTKYNYGALLIGTLGLESLIWLLKENQYKNKKFWLTQAALYLPVALIMGIWLFAEDYRFRLFLNILQNKWLVNLNETTRLGHLLYYPMELAFGYCCSWLAFVLLLVGFILALKNWRDFKVRILASFFLVNFCLAEKHMANNQARFIFTAVPAFFLLGSSGLVKLLPKLRKIGKNSFLLGILIPLILTGGVIIIKDVVLLPKAVKASGNRQTENAVFYEQDYQKVQRFNFSKDAWTKIPADPNTEKIDDIFKFVIANVDLSKEITQVGQANEFSPGLFNFYIAKAREKTTAFGTDGKFREYFVVLDVKLGGRFDTRDYRTANFSTREQVAFTLADPSLKLLAQREYPHLGVTVSILGLPSLQR